MTRVIGYMWPVVLLACGHSLPWEGTSDIPIDGAEVACLRCAQNPPLAADGALRGSI